MTRVLIAVVIAAGVVAFQIWRRTKAKRSLSGAVRSPLRLALGSSDVGLIASRELRERLRGRVLRLGTLAILGVVAAAIVIPTLSKASTVYEHVGVVGALTSAQRGAIESTGPAQGVKVVVVKEVDVKSAGAGLRSGALDIAVIGGRRLLGLSASGVAGDSYVQALATNLGIVNAFAAAGLTAAQAAQLQGAKPAPISSLVRGAVKKAASGTSIFGLILVFMMLTQYNTWILMGVLEEKTSRVVEVLLAAVRPVQLLAGKVLGIGLVAVGQATLILGFALLLAHAVGSDLLRGTAPETLAATLVWLLVGYAFYCWVYAAVGSMVSRLDEVQSLAFPLSMPIIFGYITALITVTAGTPSVLERVLAFLPPTAPFAMPVLVSLDAVTWWQFASSLAISLVATVVVARIAATVYRRAILRTGRRVRLREVLAFGRA